MFCFINYSWQPLLRSGEEARNYLKVIWIAPKYVPNFV